MPRGYLYEEHEFISSCSLSDGCFYCGGMATDWDHIVPKCRGGKDKYDNLIPSCSWCNSKKGRNTLREFRKFLTSIGRPSDFDTPVPHAVRGIRYQNKNGLGFNRFVSDDGSIVINDGGEFFKRIPPFFTPPRRSE